MTLKTVKRLDKLSAEQLEELAEAVLDFEKVADLETWLKSRKVTCHISINGSFVQSISVFCGCIACC